MYRIQYCTHDAIFSSSFVLFKSFCLVIKTSFWLASTIKTKESAYVGIVSSDVNVDSCVCKHRIISLLLFIQLRRVLPGMEITNIAIFKGTKRQHCGQMSQNIPN